MLSALLPIFAAASYGLAFAFIEKALDSINAATFLLWSGVAGVLVALPLSYFKNEPLTLSFFSSGWSMFFIVMTAVIAPCLGWLFTTYAIKANSASYAAFAEISYPLFTVFFLFLFFGIKEYGWHLLAGGSLIIIGSFILVYGQLKAE